MPIKVVAKSRSKRGASLALVIAFAWVLILCLFAALQLMRYFGASEETRNSVDASALNLAVRSPDVRIPSVMPQQYNESDCGDSNGSIGLANINRVWGKSMLINANVVSMQVENQAAPTAQESGNVAFMNAENANSELYQALTNRYVEGSLFNMVAFRRGAKLLGGNGNLTDSANTVWPTAAVFRGHESNLAFSSNQIPTDANVQVGGVNVGQQSFMPGYTPVEVNGHYFYFVALHANEKPHLISERLFTPNRVDTDPVPDITAIPNSFSATGTVQGATGALEANAFAIANPQRQYTLSIPHAYISIQVSNIAQWIVEGKMVAQSTYGMESETQWKVKNYKLTNKATLNGYASLGNEYQSASLWSALNSLPTPATPVLAKMTQRLQEIQPNFTLNQLTQLLVNQPIVPNATRYLVFPNYTTADATNPTIQIAAITNHLPPWLSTGYTADGLEKPLVQQGEETDKPNYDWQVVSAGNGGGHYAVLSGTINWEPDSGIMQCLGQMRIAHTTKCYFAVDN